MYDVMYKHYNIIMITQCSEIPFLRFLKNMNSKVVDVQKELTAYKQGTAIDRCVCVNDKKCTAVFSKSWNNLIINYVYFIVCFTPP